MDRITTSPAAAVSDGVAARARGPRSAIRHYPELDDESSTTAELQAHLPESRMVKAFNNIYFPHLTNLARPRGHGAL